MLFAGKIFSEHTNGYATDKYTSARDSNNEIIILKSPNINAVLMSNNFNIESTVIC